MYLFDTNIWLERFLDQDNSVLVGELLEQIELDQIFITDFSFHSICIILTRHQQFETLVDFIDDVIVDGEIELLTCSPDKIAQVVDVMERFGLDFDDGYQYLIAQQNNLVIVSLDSDFDKTTLGRKTPSEILAELSSPES